MIRHTYTLEEINIRRAQTLKALRHTEEEIKQRTDAMLAPPPAGNKMQMWISHAERAYAIYDGVMTGYKLFRRFRGLFSRKKK